MSCDRSSEYTALIAAIALILLVVGWLFYPLLVRAQGSHHGTHGSPHELRGYHNEQQHLRLHPWYSKLMRPDDPDVSCCSSHDCTPTQARLVDGKWQALKAGRWITIPPHKINREDSVDTAAHICWRPMTEADDSVLCFVPPGDGI